MTITNNTKSDWTVGFYIPAGKTVTMDVKKHIALAKNAQAFLDARARGDLDMQGATETA